MRENNITLSFKNITLKLKILTSHLTGIQKIITLSLIILMLSFINITLSLSNNSVSALSYESNVGIGFTFNPTLSISFSSSDLVISNLTPGTTNDSNDIIVSVSTNAAYGYTLSVGTNSDNLVHSNNSNIFSSIDTDADLSSLTVDNTWGYSYKNNLASTTTWSNYSGLSTDTSKVLFNTDSNTSSSIDFKIGAKASNTQASGTYTNTINFIAVSKPVPKTIEDIAYMQTFGELVPTDLQSVKNSMIKNTTYTLKDARDEQEYTIAKLEDGKIWMTKNLNLAGETEITSELSDVPENYTLPTANGFQEGNRLPESTQTGFNDNAIAYVYNSNNNTDNCSDPGCYSYYSWHAATVGSGANITATDIDAPYSICPKGWRLPTSRSYASTESDFYNLAVAYGMSPDNISDKSADTGDVFHKTAGIGTVPNFVISDIHYYDSFIASGGGYYWSSTIANGTRAYSLLYASFMVNSANNATRAYGFSARCLAR